MHILYKCMKYICRIIWLYRSIQFGTQRVKDSVYYPVLFYDFVGNIKFACKTIFVEIRIARKSRTLFLELHGTERGRLWLQPKITMWGLPHDKIQISFDRLDVAIIVSSAYSDNVGAMIVNDITRCCHLLRRAYDQPLLKVATLIQMHSYSVSFAVNRSLADNAILRTSKIVLAKKESTSYENSIFARNLDVKICQILYFLERIIK